jgi:hypothetical protein
MKKNLSGGNWLCELLSKRGEKCNPQLMIFLVVIFCHFEKTITEKHYLNLFILIWPKPPTIA